MTVDVVLVIRIAVSTTVCMVATSLVERFSMDFFLHSFIHLFSSAFFLVFKETPKFCFIRNANDG